MWKSDTKKDVVYIIASVLVWHLHSTLAPALRGGLGETELHGGKANGKCSVIIRL